MKLLSIGNSFSADAQRYLYRLCELNNKDMNNANLYIGGCDFKKHYINLTENIKDYSFEHCGMSTGLFVSIKDALVKANWDIITLQQQSSKSIDFNTYTPYIEKIAEVIKLYQPQAKIYIHQTWGYADYGTALKNTGCVSCEDMYNKIVDATNKAKEKIKAFGIIRTGEAILKAHKINPDITHRDGEMGFHLSLGFGRYLAACTWYKELFGKAPEKHLTYFDEEITDEQLELIKKLVEEY